MRCPIETHDNAELLLAYCARKLDLDTTLMLERHIDVCPNCKQFYQGQSMVWQALDAWEAAPVSDDFDRRLYARIENEPRTWYSRFSELFSARWTRHAIPLTAAAGLLLTAGLILQQPKPSAPVPRGPATALAKSEIAPDQLERTVEDMELLGQFTAVARTEASSDTL